MRKILEEGKVTYYQQILKSGTIVVTREDKEPLPKDFFKKLKDSESKKK